MKKITKREYKKFVEPSLRNERFSRVEREAIESVFMSDLQDMEQDERRSWFSPAVPGISENELNKRLKELRSSDSSISKALKYPLYKYPEKIDKLEEIMREALEGNKEPLF